MSESSSNSQPLERFKTYNGSIQLIIGPIFSCKTTELIRIINRYNLSKKKTMLIKSDKTVDYDEDSDVLHEKANWYTITSTSLMTIKDKALDADVIGIDEGQLFKDIKEFSLMLADYGKKVIVAALDGTYQMEPFHNIIEMIPIVDSVRKLRAICVYCGKEASFSIKITNDNDESECQSVCRRCYHSYNSHGNRKITDFFRRDVSTPSSQRKNDILNTSSLMIQSLEEPLSQSTLMK